MKKFATQAIHSGNEPDFEGSGDVVVPIHLSTTFARRRVNIPTKGYEYSRSSNPTRYALEKNLAALENGKFGFAFSSGLSAITNVLMLLNSGDHVLSIDDVYGGTRRLFLKVFEKFGLQFDFVDFNKGKDLQDFIKNNTKMIWLESPTNPLLKVINISSVAKFAKSKKIFTVLDNTFATPVFQKPLDLGADIVVHSLTKYLGGHSDVIGGAVIVKDKQLAEKIKFLQNAVGAILSPFDSYNALRGIKTLEIRMLKHQENAKKIVLFLKGQKQVKRIFYPNFGGMVSFELEGEKRKTIKFLENLKIISLAESLGAVESLIEHPASMTHASVPKEDREKIGISGSLVRLSVGLEDPEDLIEDLTQALEKN